MDTSILTSLVSVEELDEERPELAARMRQSGPCEQLLEPTSPRGVLWMITLGGAIALAISIALLAGIRTAVRRLHRWRRRTRIAGSYSSKVLFRAHEVAKSRDISIRTLCRR
jgi:hypothetical protein